MEIKCSCKIVWIDIGKNNCFENNGENNQYAEYNSRYWKQEEL